MTENKVAPRNQRRSTPARMPVRFTRHPRPLWSGRTIRREITRQLRQTIYVESADCFRAGVKGMTEGLIEPRRPELDHRAT